MQHLNVLMDGASLTDSGPPSVPDDRE